MLTDTITEDRTKNSTELYAAKSNKPFSKRIHSWADTFDLTVNLLSTNPPLKTQCSHAHAVEPWNFSHPFKDRPKTKSTK